MRIGRKFAVWAALLASGLAALAAGPAGSAEIFIGTGSETGVYYQVGRAICRLLNAQTVRHGIDCEPLPTAGSIYNITNVRAGRLHLGVAQSDWQYHAVKGTSAFETVGPDPDLRALFSLHGEPFTVVARRDAGIKRFLDLKGKRVNIGNPGSGQRATMEVVMQAEGWTENVFAQANDLPASQQSVALCDGRVQAIVYTVGHPNASVGQATGLCDAVIVEVKSPAIDRLVQDRPFYAYTEIPGGVYSGNPDPVVTFGVNATVVASAKVDADTVYTVVKTVFDDLERFKKMHPAFGGLDAGRMIKDGLTAPLHDGALRYYKERGLM
jgi:TRAP transporter TAXI family solute receptor